MTHKWFKLPAAGENRASPMAPVRDVYQCSACGKQVIGQPSQTERCKRKFGRS